MSRIEAAARKLAEADWVHGPAPADNWNRLTFGEQHRYTLQAIRDSGAPLIPEIGPKEQQFLNNKIAEAVGWIIRHREAFGHGPE